MFQILKTMFRRKAVTSVEDNLKFYMGMSESIIALGFFGLIFKNKLNVGDYFADGNLEFYDIFSPDFWSEFPRFLSVQWLGIVFSLFIILWFFAYRIAVKTEMEILVGLYSRINPPHDWERTIGARMIPFLSLGLTFAFLGLAFFMDNLPVFCAIMLFLSVQDAAGNNILRKNMVRHFLRPQFNPHASDLLGPFILRRREVALEYWVWKPQIERVGLMMIGTVVALLVSLSGELFGVVTGDWLPVVLIIAIILANETVMGRWRVERNEALDAIDEDQVAFEQEAGAGTDADGAPPPAPPPA